MRNQEASDCTDPLVPPVCNFRGTQERQETSFATNILFAEFNASSVLKL